MWYQEDGGELLVQLLGQLQMAINLGIQLTQYSQDCDDGPKTLAVLYSNRSAAFASVHRWDEAADDAEQCIALMPNWSKVNPLRCIKCR